MEFFRFFICKRQAELIEGEMNMKRITAFILILAVLTSFAACSSKPADVPDAESKTEVTAEEPTAAAEPEKTSNEATADAPGEWDAAYQEYLLNVLPDIAANEYFRENTQYIRFGLIYLNDDDVPELWYNDSLGAHGPNYVIRTYRDGKVTEVGDGYTILEYYEKQGVFSFTAAGGAAGYDVTYYRMTDDGCEQLDAYSEYADMSVAPDQDGNMTVICTLNGVDISEEERQAFLDQYTSRYGQATTVENEDGFPLTEENILANCK